MPSEFYPLTLALMAAASAGLVGAFALMKRTVLAGDVMSHIAIPGIGLAAIWRINPLAGAGLTLFAGILIIWQLQKKTELSSEAAIGVIFASSVAVGALLINSKEELVDALFGGFEHISQMEFLFGMAASVLVILSLWFLRNKLIIALFSPELASSANVHVDRVNLWFLLIFGLTILSSLPFLGALLVGSLIIIPAAVGRQLSHTLGTFLLLSCLASVLSVALGFTIAPLYHLALGPTIVTIATIFFALSLLKKKK